MTAVIDAWAAGERDTNSLLLDVQHDHAVRRWYVRMRGDDKAVITVWLTLGERTLDASTWFMPAPEENLDACYGYLLRANAKMFGLAFAVGHEDAVYLRGQAPLAGLDEGEVDRIVGSCWAWSERYFRSAMSIGFASRYPLSS